VEIGLHDVEKGDLVVNDQDRRFPLGHDRRFDSTPDRPPGGSEPSMNAGFARSSPAASTLQGNAAAEEAP
jgi:hypothetical protein